MPPHEIKQAWKDDHVAQLRRLIDYADGVARLAAEGSADALRFRGEARRLVHRFPVAPSDARECAPKTEAREEKKAALLDKHDWEPWEKGHKISLDMCKTGTIVVLPEW